MRYFVIGFLIFTGFSASHKWALPKYVEGDCFSYIYKMESWETPLPIKKVIEVGEKSYRVSYFINGRWHESTFSEALVSTYNTTEKVECPETKK